MKKMLLKSASPRKPKIYSAPGRCIYGSGPDHDNVLSREHILPRGLRGGLIFLKASCENCRKITQKIEETCLRRMLLPYRLHAGWVSHKDDLPSRIPLLVNRDLQNPGRLIATHDHPQMLVLPIFLQPPG